MVVVIDPSQLSKPLLIFSGNRINVLWYQYLSTGCCNNVCSISRENQKTFDNFINLLCCWNWHYKSPSTFDQ